MTDSALAGKLSRIGRDHWFFLCLLAVYAITFVATLSDYGVTWDSTEYYVGDKHFHFYTSLDSKYLDFRAKNIPDYEHPEHPDFYKQSERAMYNPFQCWPVGPTVSAVTKHLFFTHLGWLDVYDAHHLGLLPFLMALLVGLYVFTNHHLGRGAAIVAVLCVALYPRFLGHAHNNLKDVPSAAMYSLVLFAFHYALLGNRWKWLLGASVLWGIAVATKANAVFIPIVLAPWFAYIMYQRRQRQETLLSKRMLWLLVAFPGISFVVYLIMWPYMLVNFPTHLRLHVGYLKWRGAQGSSDWNGEPIVNAIVTMPSPILILVVVGLVAIGMQTYRRRRLDELHLLVCWWAVVAVLRVSVPKAVDFDVIRHWLEFVPAVALIAAIGATSVGQWLQGVAKKRLGPKSVLERAWLWYALAVLWLAPVLWWNILNHPNQMVFYNQLIGGLPGAQASNLKETTDYWGQSYRQGIKWLNANAQPNSKLLVDVAQHLVSDCRHMLRPDVVYTPMEKLRASQIVELLNAHNGSAYLMYITRKNYYSPFGAGCDAKIAPVHTITVDGAPILKILRLK